MARITFLKLIPLFVICLGLLLSSQSPPISYEKIIDLFKMGNYIPHQLEYKTEALKTITNILSKEILNLIDVKYPKDLVVPSGSGKFFSVLSYNLLADTYTNGLDRDCSPTYLNFVYRSTLIIEELKKINSDIILLEELDHFEDFYKSEFEKIGYNFVFATREGRSDIAFIGFKRNVFELISEDKINFDIGHRYEKNTDFIRKNVAAVASLKHKEFDRVINVIGTHFFWNPRQEHVKYFQMEYILEYINSKFKRDDIVIWGGDLNSKPGDNNIMYLKNKQAPKAENIEFYSDKILKFSTEMYQELEKIDNPFEWGNAYEFYGLSIGDDNMMLPKFTNFTLEFKSTIDHIFYNKKNLIPRKLLKVPDTETIRDIALPNQRHPSDHLPIMSVFEIL